MKDVYVILHCYTVDGGFGDSVAVEDVIGFVTSEEEAKEYCEKYDSTHVYDEPYAELVCGELAYVQLNHLTTAQSPWNEKLRKQFDRPFRHMTKTELTAQWKL